jgi:hypothetical protein
LHVVGDGHADRVAQPAARGGEPDQEVVGATAGIGADQHPAPQRPGQLRQRQPRHLDVLSRRVRPGAASTQHDGQRFAARPGAVIGERCQRMEPERLFPSRRGFLLL